MEMVTQQKAIQEETLSAKDEVAFWRDPRWDDLECLHATFVNHEYAPHTHDTSVIGVIVDGVECYRLRGMELHATAGDVCVVNPGELHDGRPGDRGYRYRMFYPSTEVLAELYGQITESSPAPVYFAQPLFRDPDVYRLLCGAHSKMETAPTHLERDTAFLEAASLLIRRHGDRLARDIKVGDEALAVRQVCDFAEDNLDGDLDLEAMARIAGFSRYRLIRSFRRELGVTPHAWVTGRRIARAKALLAAGDLPATVAAACGLYDQAHLTRHFKAATGVTPAKYRAAFAA